MLSSRTPELDKEKKKIQICDCYMAEVFYPTAWSLIGSFEVTWQLTPTLFPVKSLQAVNIDLLSVKVAEHSFWYLCFIHLFL